MTPPPPEESTPGSFILHRAQRSPAPPPSPRGLHVPPRVHTLARRRIVGHPWALLLLAATALGQNPPTTVAVDANASRHPINPNIYGICYGDAGDMAALNAPLNRWGGNATSRYNWQIDAHSADSDWYFETYSDGPGTPSGSADAFVAATRSAKNGAEPLITIPMLDYLANLGPGRTTLEGFAVKKYGAQTATDPWNPDAGNGMSAATGKSITGNDPNDTGVANSTALQQAWVEHFVGTLGNATTPGGIKYYILDNEPSLWSSTQRDVHPLPTGDEELFTRISSYSAAIRAADPKAKIAGPEEWSWWAMYASGLDQANGTSAAASDYNTHGRMYHYPWLLQQLQAYKQKTGAQLIDIFTVHGYSDLPDGNDDSASGRQLRNRQTRILWDPNYQDPEWFGDIGINGRLINWIPSLKAMVNQYCPGLQIGFTEYNWGDEANLNGATAQADVLGIYGREGIDLATRWTTAKNTSTTPATIYVTYLASQIYRNYDGRNSAFGDVGVSAAVANPDNLSAFAAVRSSDGAFTVMVINKQEGSTPVALSIANFSAGGTAQAWQINSASQASIARLADVPVSAGSVSLTVPSQSITLLVIPPGAAPRQANRLMNISTRSLVGTGSSVEIAGFVVTGTQPKTVLIRANGPSLAAFNLTGVLADPSLALVDANYAEVAQNTGWCTAPNVSAIQGAAALAGAFPWPIGSKDSAILLTLNPGAYTALISGASGDTGVALAEVYDCDAPAAAQRMINISTRSLVGTGQSIQVAGFVVGGTQPKSILIRASGPALAPFGVSGTLPDPTLKLFDSSGSALTQNTGWGSSANAPAIQAAAARVGAFPWAGGSGDSAILVTLPPGAYTAQVSGASGDTGVALVEVYDAD